MAKIREITEKSSGGDYIYRGEPKHYKKVSSTLYRQYEADIESVDFDIEVAQNEMLTEAKDYIYETDEGFEILTQLQHFGGKTNLIDFTTDYLIALFFACVSLFDKPGRVILLDESAQEENRAQKPRNMINRVRDQKSIFTRPPKGFIEIEPHDAINIPKCLKQPMLDYLRKYHDISTKTIYNDLHGFIRYQDIHEGAYTQFYRGFTCHGRGDEAVIAKQKQREYEKSIEHYTRAIELNPGLTSAYHNRGHVYYKTGEIEYAIADYTKAIDLEPNNPNIVQAYHNRGHVYCRRGEVEYAIADYTKVIDLNPNYVNAYAARGLIYGVSGDYEHAIVDCNRAIELDPNNSIAYDVRGLVYKYTGKYECAIADYTKAIDLNPNGAQAYYSRGESLLHLREWERAKSDMTTAREKGVNIVDVFRDNHRSVVHFEERYGIQLPEDIAAMLIHTH